MQQLSWNECVEKLAALYSAGISEREASLQVRGKKVSWEGRISEFASGFAPGIRVQMALVSIRASNGWLFEADELFLPLQEEADRDFCRALGEGAVVRFSASLEVEGNFSVVGFAEDSEQGKVFLMLGLKSVRILRNA